MIFYYLILSFGFRYWELPVFHSSYSLPARLLYIHRLAIYALGLNKVRVTYSWQLGLNCCIKGGDRQHGRVRAPDAFIARALRALEGTPVCISPP